MGPPPPPPPPRSVNELAPHTAPSAAGSSECGYRAAYSIGATLPQAGRGQRPPTRRTPVHRNITLAHIPPAHSEAINFFGAIEVDIDGELAQLGPTRYRPLRVLDILF